MDKVEFRERRFAHAVRTTLNESAGQLPPDVRDHLAAVCRMTLAQKKAEAPSAVYSPTLVVPGGGSVSFEMGGEAPSPLQRVTAVLRRLGLPWSTTTLVAGLAGIYQWQQQQRVDELTEVDAAMLFDDLPLAAYAGQGFHQYLKHDQ